MSELKSKAINGVFWSFIERFGTLSIQFVANIVLARLLSPDDYGLLGILLIFISISTIFIDSGFGSALIQKKNTDNEDYSTVFIINFVIALVCYTLLFVSSDFIANYFGKAQLSILLRVLGLVLIFNALSTVQNNILQKTLNFKRITNIKIIVAIASSGLAILAALNGMGVWSLVVLNITNSVVLAILLWLSTDWYPSLKFSKQSFNELFGFGSKLLLASLLSEGYRNLQSIIIGRNFSVKDLGYFTQAKQLENIPVATLITVVNKVTYPVFAQIQDNKNQLNNGLKRCFQLLGFANFPLMILLAVIGEPLFDILYGDKWLVAVPYFQGLCIGFGLLLVIHNTNLNAIKAVGQSGIVLKLEIVKKILGIGLIFVLMKYGVMGIILALAINSICEFFINGYYTGKYVGFGIVKQAKVLVPILLLSTVAGGISYYVSLLISTNNIILLSIQILIYLVVYFSGAYVLKFDILLYVIDMIKEKFKK
ncbi:MAG: lipopolysaccharide biosynthesis protein [Rikenellaceae bacterium]